MTEVIWFAPVCDTLLKRMVYLAKTYTLGTVYASKSFLNTDGRLEDRPTIYINKIRLTEAELIHLVRLTTTLAPKLDATAQFQKVLAEFKTNRKIFKLYPPNNYEFSLALYPTELNKVLEVLMNAKQGMTTNMNDLIINQKEGGKSPFEI
jgi:hypothetical protein